MHVRCPHCHNPIEFVDDAEQADLGEIQCPSCGSSLSLVEAGTTTYDAAGLTIGHFELVEQVGIGAYGSVWKAHDTELDRIVAVKIPRKDQLDTAETEQFLREARAAAQLRHRHIVNVHEVGRQNGQVYIVSDFVQGANLSDWMQTQPFSAREAAELCVKIAEALHHAHEEGVIHRDLKPSNIMIDLEGEPHLMDFGLAKREAGEITVTMEGRLIGTPAYMSPEQARGEGHHADRRSDVYSLGVVLFQLLTGELPFRGNPRMLIVQVLKDDPPSPRKLNGSVPRDLETICLKCLEKEQAKRYESAHDLAEDLNQFLLHKPIDARPVSRAERVWRWCRRNPVVTALSSSVLAVLVIGTIVSSYFAIQADSETERAIAEKDRADENAKHANAEAARADRNATRAEITRKLAEQSKHDAQVRLLESNESLVTLNLEQVRGLQYSSDPSRQQRALELISDAARRANESVTIASQLQFDTENWTNRARLQYQQQIKHLRSEAAQWLLDSKVAASSQRRYVDFEDSSSSPLVSLADSVAQAHWWLSRDAKTVYLFRVTGWAEPSSRTPNEYGLFAIDVASATGRQVRSLQLESKGVVSAKGTASELHLIVGFRDHVSLMTYSLDAVRSGMPQPNRRYRLCEIPPQSPPQSRVTIEDVVWQDRLEAVAFTTNVSTRTGTYVRSGRSTPTFSLTKMLHVNRVEDGSPVFSERVNFVYPTAFSESGDGLYVYRRRRGASTKEIGKLDFATRSFSLVTPDHGLEPRNPQDAQFRPSRNEFGQTWRDLVSADGRWGLFAVQDPFRLQSRPCVIDVSNGTFHPLQDRPTSESTLRSNSRDVEPLISSRRFAFADNNGLVVCLTSQSFEVYSASTGEQIAVDQILERDERSWFCPLFLDVQGDAAVFLGQDGGPRKLSEPAWIHSVSVNEADLTPVTIAKGIQTWTKHPKSSAFYLGKTNGHSKLSAEPSRNLWSRIMRKPPLSGFDPTGRRLVQRAGNHVAIWNLDSGKREHLLTGYLSASNRWVIGRAQATATRPSDDSFRLYDLSNDSPAVEIAGNNGIAEPHGKFFALNKGRQFVNCEEAKLIDGWSELEFSDEFAGIIAERFTLYVREVGAGERCQLMVVDIPSETLVTQSPPLPIRDFFTSVLATGSDPPPSTKTRDSQLPVMAIADRWNREKVVVWNPADDGVTLLLVTEGTAPSIKQCQFLNDGAHFLVVVDKGIGNVAVNCFDVKTGDRVWSIGEDQSSETLSTRKRFAEYTFVSRHGSLVYSTADGAHILDDVEMQIMRDRSQVLGSAKQIVTAVPKPEVEFETRVISLNDGQKLGTWQRPVICLSPDERYALLDDGTVINMETGTEHFNVDDVAGVMQEPYFSPDGNWLLTWSGPEASKAFLHDLKSKDRQTLSLPRSEDHVFVFSPDGTHLAHVSLSSAVVTVWTVADGERVYEGSLAHPHQLPPTGKHSELVVQISPDNRRISIETNGRPRIIDLQREGLNARLGRFSHEGPVSCLALSSDGTFLATGSHDKTVCLWRALDGHFITMLESFDARITDLQLSSDDQYLLFRDESGLVGVWRIEVLDAELVNASIECDLLWSKRLSRGSVVAIRPSRPELMVVGFPNSEVYILSVEDGSLMGLIDPNTHEGADATCLAYDESGELLAVGHRDGIVRVWQIDTKSIVGEWNLGPQSPIRSLAINGNLVAVVGLDVTLWDLKTSLRLAPLVRAERQPNSVQFSDDGERLYVEVDAALESADAGYNLLALPIGALNSRLRELGLEWSASSQETP